MPRPTAWPVAVRSTVSDELIWPVRFAVTFTTPPHNADTVPSMDVRDSLEICHCRLVQAEIFGNPAIVGDAHDPAAGATGPPVTVPPDEEPDAEPEEDEDADPPDD